MSYVALGHLMVGNSMLWLVWSSLTSLECVYHCLRSSWVKWCCWIWCLNDVSSSSTYIVSWLIICRMWVTSDSSVLWLVWSSLTSLECVYHCLRSSWVKWCGVSWRSRLGPMWLLPPLPSPLTSHVRNHIGGRLWLFNYNNAIFTSK